MDTFNEIREAIATKVLTADSVQASYAYPRSTLEGFPAAVIMPSENQSDYGSTHNDRVVFVFRVMLYAPIKDEGAGEAAEQALGKAVGELVFDTFKSRDSLIEVCDHIEPAAGIFGESTVGQGVYRTAEVTLRCVKYL
jgi:hypothetical protein